MDNSTSVITGKVRMMYANVFVPTSMEEGGKKKYNVCLAIPKSDKKTIAAIQAAINQAYENGKEKLGNKKLAQIKTPLKDGDIDRPEDENFANCMYMNANSVRKPGIVDENVQAIMDSDEFYSGCYGRASINLYAFAVPTNKGIACGLNNLQKLEDGDNLEGGSSAEQDFGAASDDDDLM
jgi:hypothetical protein